MLIEYRSQEVILTGEADRKQFFKKFQLKADSRKPEMLTSKLIGDYIFSH